MNTRLCSCCLTKLDNLIESMLRMGLNIKLNYVFKDYVTSKLVIVILVFFSGVGKAGLIYSGVCYAIQMIRCKT